MKDSFFYPLKVSSKFPICNLPLRLDSYNRCSFNCKYCFSNNRSIGKRNTDSKPNIKWLRNKYRKVYDEKNINKTNFLEVLLSKRITLHCGGQSDPFPIYEKEYNYTKEIVELSNEYNLSILFSTKNCTYYNVPCNPSLHSFQLSITNTFNDKNIEENVPLFKNRLHFYHQLKDEGYRVGIRLQPYIDEYTDFEKIIEYFNDADHFTIESLKLVPGGKYNNYLKKYFNYKDTDFTNMGLLNLKPYIRYNYYQKIIKILEDYGLSYSISDNDLHYLGNNNCCCGDQLVKNTIPFANTRLLKKYGRNYTINNVFQEAEDYLNCKCSSLYTSSRRKNCRTVQDFYNKRFNQKKAIFNPKTNYYE